MLRIRFNKTLWSTVVLCIFVFLPLWAVSLADGQKHVGSKELIRTVSSNYVISQMGKEIGSEATTRSDFNDNSVVYESEIKMTPAETVNIVVRSELVLEQESRFPVRYAMKKDLKQGELDIVHETDVNLYSNIAVIRSLIGENEATTKKVLPTGAAFLDANGCFSYYQLLFWYDKSMGGRQTFNVFDPILKKTEPVILHLTTTETVVAAGDSASATVYEMERKKQRIVKIFVDDDERIVRFEQNYMVYELTEWSEQSAETN